MTVERTALQFGASRVSFEVFYFVLSILLLVAVLALSGYIAFHALHVRRKHSILRREIREAEESVRRGFAILRNDIKAELETIHKAKLSKALSEEEKTREKRLLSDLGRIEQRIGREIWEVEQAEHHL